MLANRPASGKETLKNQKKGSELLVILEGINNPVNVGTVLRSAEAAGASGVITTENSSDPFSPKALRGAMGSAFRLPIWSGASYEEALNWCAERKIKTVGADLSATQQYTNVDWRTARALVVGRESSGLSADQVKRLDEAVRIPMHGEVESLNVAVAAGILLYEANRQRSS